MKLATMIGDVLRSLLERPATRRYPFERSPAPARLRGQLHWDPTSCTGCRVCVMDCPADALELAVVDKAARRFVLRYDVGRCTYCSQCVTSCVRDCLSLSNTEWELAGTDRRAFHLDYGAPDDVARVVASESDPGPERAGGA